ncbi:MAG: MarR family winged helix-turn-helix transcriptional regulator [Spirochaetota bacterium]
MASRNKINDFSVLPEKLEGNFTKDEECSLSLYMSLARASQTFSKELAKEIRENNLTPPQFGVLETLMHLGPTTLSSLGEKLLVTAGNITCVVDKLEGMGLVRRERNGNDRRIIIAELTENGKEMIHSLFPNYVKKITDLSSDLTEKEKQQLQKLLKKLCEAIPNAI